MAPTDASFPDEEYPTQDIPPNQLVTETTAVVLLSGMLTSSTPSATDTFKSDAGLDQVLVLGVKGNRHLVEPAIGVDDETTRIHHAVTVQGDGKLSLRCGHSDRKCDQ